MKKLLLLICLLYFSEPGKAQNADSIPNPGFENWIWVGWVTNPVGWITNNSQMLASTVLPDTNSYSGDYAMKLVNNGSFPGNAACGFTLNHHPLALYGHVKNMLSSGDHATVEVQVYHNGSLVDSGYQEIYGGFNPNYTSFSVPIAQNSPIADSCVISFYGGLQNLSEILFDDLLFTFTSGIFEMPEPLQFHVGPNPVNNVLYVYLPWTGVDDQATVGLYDIEGKKIIERKLYSFGLMCPLCETLSGSVITEQLPAAEQQNPINLEGLSKGVYLLNIFMDGKRGTQLIIKE